MADAESRAKKERERWSRELAVLLKFIKSPTKQTMIISGLPGSGKRALVSYLIQELPARLGFRWVDLEPLDNPLRFLELHIEKTLIPKRKPLGRGLGALLGLDDDLVIILNGTEKLSLKELQRVFDRLLKITRVKSVIALNSFPQSIRGAETIRLGKFPDQELYELKKQLTLPLNEVIPAVAPQIITVNESIIGQLRRSPNDLFKISPRQFEEVIAELLSNMGMDVQLTPATRDGGKDILVHLKSDLGSFLCLVETKQYRQSHPVGVGLVRALYGTLEDHRATSAMLITTSRFAKPAQQFQQRHQYELSLKDYADIVSWLAKYKT